jgi:hypothetical protein
VLGDLPQGERFLPYGEKNLLPCGNLSRTPTGRGAKRRTLYFLILTLKLKFQNFKSFTGWLESPQINSGIVKSLFTVQIIICKNGKFENKNQNNLLYVYKKFVTPSSRSIGKAHTLQQMMFHYMNTVLKCTRFPLLYSCATHLFASDQYKKF